MCPPVVQAGAQKLSVTVKSRRPGGDRPSRLPLCPRVDINRMEKHQFDWTSRLELRPVGDSLPGIGPEGFGRASLCRQQDSTNMTVALRRLPRPARPQYEIPVGVVMLAAG